MSVSTTTTTIITTDELNALVTRALKVLRRLLAQIEAVLRVLFENITEPE